jgi:pre-mRNA-splicing factor RBM22/SLT11
MRFRRTEICQTCARIKSICQTCSFDLRYHVPTAVRDAALQIKTELPSEDANRQYFVQNAETLMYGASSLMDYTKSESAGRELVKRLARIDPYSRYPLRPICNYFLKGNCYRGDACPYLHETKTTAAPNTALLAQPEEKLALGPVRSDRFRFYGNTSKVGEGDVLSSRLLEDAMTAEHTKKHRLSSPPIDKSITSLYIGGVTDDITEHTLQNHFIIYGKIQKIIPIKANHGAYVLFEDRSSAEKAMDELHGSLTLKGVTLDVRWGTVKKLESHPMAKNLLYPHLSVYDDADNTI